MATRFSRPRLITADDRQYRAFIAQIMLGKDNQRPTRPPRARELFGGEAEAALRDWLSERLTLSERRFVEYYEHRGRSAVKKYRELDAVVIDAPKTVHVFEMKASQKAISMRRASRQLHDTRTILRMLFPYVSATIMLVDTGMPTADDVTALMAEPDAPPEPPPTLEQILATLPHVRRIHALDDLDPSADVVNLLRFSVDDIIAMAGAENLHLDWDEEELEEAEEAEQAEEPPTPRFAYSTDQSEAAQDDDEEGGAFGDAWKQALSGRKENKGKS
jgi:hypothetical protein